MKILFFTPTLPLPPYSGGQVRSLNLLKQINRKHEVTLFSFIRNSTELNYLDDLKKIVKEVKTFRRRPLNSVKNLRYMLHYPFAAALYYDPEILKELGSVIETGYDLVHFESFYTFPYLTGDIKCATIAGNQNVEYSIYERFASTKREPTRSLMKIDTRRMKAFEESKWRLASTAIAVSQPDAQLMEKVVGKTVPVIPNGVDLKYFKDIKRKEEKNLFLFVGPTTYIQNDDAARYLTSEIWPEIKKQIPDAKLWFVGHKQKQWLLNLNDPDITVQTDLTDIREAYQKASLLIAPLRAGSGTKFKVLEAFACRVPVLSSPVGIEGIEAVDNQSVMLADRPLDFAQKAKLVLEDKVLNAKIVSNAKALVEESYSWDKIGQKLNQVYHDQAA